MTPLTLKKLASLGASLEIDAKKYTALTIQDLVSSTHANRSIKILNANSLTPLTLERIVSLGKNVILSFE